MMPEPQQIWGWTSYELTPWRDDDGRKLYVAHFRREHDYHSWSTQTIRFWARRPLIALRTIANSGNEPCEYNNATIN